MIYRKQKTEGACATYLAYGTISYQYEADSKEMKKSIRKHPSGTPEIAREICVMGMRRSGNHAVINWIIRQMEERSVIFLNNVWPRADKNGNVEFSAGSNCEFRDGFPVYPDKIDLLIYSYEDMKPNYVENPLYRRLQDRYIGSGKERQSIILLRDPFNLFASRLQGLSAGAENMDRSSYFGMQNLWIAYAREYLGMTHWLGENTVRVNYNKWCRDKEWRRDLAQQLGIPFTDAGFTEVPAVFNGSSFDGRDFDGQGDQMKTARRWRSFTESAQYLALFRDPYLLDLYYQAFKPDHDLRKFIQTQIAKGVSQRAVWRRMLCFLIYLPLVTIRFRLLCWLERMKMIFGIR